MAGAPCPERRGRSSSGPPPTMDPACDLEPRDHTRVEGTGKKTHWSSWGNDFPKTCSGDHCVTHTPGMERGHTSMSWFSRGQRGLHQKTSEGSQSFNLPWGAADLDSFLQSKLWKTKSPNSNTIPGCVLPGNLSWGGPGRWFQKSRAKSTEPCCLPEAEARWGRAACIYPPASPPEAASPPEMKQVSLPRVGSPLGNSETVPCVTQPIAFIEPRVRVRAAHEAHKGRSSQSLTSRRRG